MDLLARSLLQNRVVSGLCHRTVDVSGLCYRTVDNVAVLVTKPLPAPVSVTEPAIKQPEHVQLGEMRTGLVAVWQLRQYQQQWQQDQYQYCSLRVSQPTVMLSSLAQGPGVSLVSTK